MFNLTKNIILFTSFSTYLLASPMNVIKIENPDGSELKFKVTKHTNHYFDDILAEEKALQNAIKAKKTGSTSKVKYASRDNGDSKELIQEAKNHLGGRYVWGGTRPSGFDCSGYVQYLYKKEGVNLPRTAMAQSQVGKDVTMDELQKGDLLFFKTTQSRHIPVTHVGIYMGENKFIHAASKKLGIIVSKLEGGSYESKLVKAKRII